MQTNRLNLRNVVAIAICLVALTMFASYEKVDNQAEKSLVGKWVTSDYNSGHNDTICFTANMRIENYFIFAHTAMYHANSYYFTYFLTENTIEITSHQPEIEEFSETFGFIIKGNSLTIKGFSNPFSDTKEGRRDVRFTKNK